MTDPTGYAPRGPLETAPSGPFTHPADRHAAFTAALAGADLGTYDWRIIDWLCGMDDPTCRTVVSLLWRARTAGQPCE
jgi:hypothetical protein